MASLEEIIERALKKAELSIPGKAIYIGSGPIERIEGIACFVKAKEYVLSDFGFEQEKTFPLKQCKVRVTNRDGYRVACEEKPDFVLIDLGSMHQESFEKMYLTLSLGTYLCFDRHAEEYTQNYTENRTGIKRISDFTYQKTKHCTKEDLEVAKSVYQYIHKITGLKGISGRTNQYGEFSRYWMKCSNDQGFILDSCDLKEELIKLIPLLNGNEKEAIMQNLLSTCSDLDKNPTQTHKEIKKNLIGFLNKIRV